MRLRVVLLAACAVAVSVGGGGAFSAPAAGRAARRFPSTRSGILVFNDQLAMRSTSEAQVRFAARHYAGSQKLTRSEARHLRRYNPSFLVLHYRLGQSLGHSPADANGDPTGRFIQIVRGDQWVREWPGDAAAKEEWFFHWGGSRVFCRDWGHYLMDLDNPGWRAWWSDQVIRELKANEDDGVFADSYMVPNYGFTWNPPLPAVDAAFETDWARREHAFTDYIRSRFAGRWKWIPNVSGLTTTRDPSDYSNVDGVMIEGFAEGGHGQWFPIMDWELQMNRILPLVRADRILIAQSYPEITDVEERLFILSSYLLIKGDHSYLNLEVSSLPEWFPEYDLNLGPPKDHLPKMISALLHPSWQVYVRRYAKGFVLVNPTETERRVDLGRQYFRVQPRGGGVVAKDGVPPGSLTYEPVRALVLGAHRSAVLLTKRPTAGGSPLKR